jgi:hypothetical protein
VLKCGVERALTKQESAEPVQRCSLEVEEVGKMSPICIQKMLEDNAFIIHSVKIMPSQGSNQKKPLPALSSFKLSKLDKATRKLYDLEPNCQTEKPLKIDLNLYQMEEI